MHGDGPAAQGELVSTGMNMQVTFNDGSMRTIRDYTNKRIWEWTDSYYAPGTERRNQGFYYSFETELVGENDLYMVDIISGS